MKKQPIQPLMHPVKIIEHIFKVVRYVLILKTDFSHFFKLLFVNERVFAQNG